MKLRADIYYRQPDFAYVAVISIDGQPVQTGSENTRHEVRRWADETVKLIKEYNDPGLRAFDMWDRATWH